MAPKSRQEQLLVEEVADELVVFDQERNRAHRLNRTAWVVWRNCDGQRSVADLTALLQHELNPVADENLVLLTLDRLSSAHLLQEPIQRPVAEARNSRRQFLQKVGMVGTLTLLIPVVQSIVAPTPAQASSPGGPCCCCCCEEIC